MCSIVEMELCKPYGKNDRRIKRITEIGCREKDAEVIGDIQKSAGVKVWTRSTIDGLEVNGEHLHPAADRYEPRNHLSYMTPNNS